MNVCFITWWDQDVYLHLHQHIMVGIGRLIAKIFLGFPKWITLQVFLHVTCIKKEGTKFLNIVIHSMVSKCISIKKNI